MMNFDLKKIFEWPFAAQIALLSVSAIILFYIGYLIDLSPMQSQIVANDQQLTDLKQQLQIMLNKQIEIKTEISQLPQLKLLLKGWQQQKFIDDATLPGTLNSILKFGENNQLKFNTFDPGKELKEGDYTKIPVKIQMSGTYDETATFISQVASMKKIVRIGDFSMIKEEPSEAETMNPLTSDDIFNTQLTLEIFKK